MRKDVADLFAAEGKGARKTLKNLAAGALDALELALTETSEERSVRERYLHARESVLPLLTKIKDPGEREATLADVVDRLKLKGMTRELRKALNEAEEDCRRKGEPRKEVEEAEPGSLPDDAEELIAQPGVMGRYVEAVARIHGVIRDRNALSLQFLVAAGAQLQPLPNGRPAGANLILTAEAGRGKNYVCDAVASALPEAFYLAFESASAKSLYYQSEKDPAVLRHRWLYPNEAEATDQLVEMFRPLLSGGKASHLTVNKDATGRNAAQELTLEGPASVTIPTVRNKLDGQLQTRMLVAELEDYEGRVPEHSRAVSRQLLPERAGEDHSAKVRAWQAALKVLAQVRRVVFPLEHEGFCFNSNHVSHGARLWGNVLGLMLAHAWLEQRNREITELSTGERAVVATPEDYEAAYAVFKATCERSVINLSDTHRRILDAVYELKEEGQPPDGLSHRKIAEKAGVHHSTVGEHKAFLTKSAKLLWETEGGGLDLVAEAEPSWWRKGDEPLVGFPTPEHVRQWYESRRRSSAPQSARQDRHLENVKQIIDTSTQNPGGYHIRHPNSTGRHLNHPKTTSLDSAGTDTSAADEAPATGHGSDKPKNESFGLVAGVAGASRPNAGDRDGTDRERFTV